GLIPLHDSVAHLPDGRAVQLENQAPPGLFPVLGQLPGYLLLGGSQPVREARMGHDAAVIPPPRQLRRIGSHGIADSQIPKLQVHLSPPREETARSPDVRRRPSGASDRRRRTAPPEVRGPAAGSEPRTADSQ